MMVMILVMVVVSVMVWFEGSFGDGCCDHDYLVAVVMVVMVEMMLIECGCVGWVGRVVMVMILVMVVGRWWWCEAAV